jgi:hypothetical protein
LYKTYKSSDDLEAVDSGAVVRYDGDVEEGVEQRSFGVEGL